MILKEQITKIFCVVDEFMIELNHKVQSQMIGNPPKRKPRMSSSEVISIMIFFQLSACRNFKSFYLLYVKRIFNHKVFKGIATTGKSTMGYFYGF